MVTEKATEKLNALCVKHCSHYHAYFDETYFKEDQRILSVMLLTNDKRRLANQIKKIIKKCSKQIPTINCSPLHFTDILNSGNVDFLAWALAELKKVDFIVAFNFVDAGELRRDGYTGYMIRGAKMRMFVGDFMNIAVSKLGEENITFIFDQGFLPNPQIKKYFFIVHEHTKKGSHANFIPDVPKFQPRIKKGISDCKWFMVFPTEVAMTHEEKGIQAVDMVTGALRQAMKGDKQFLDIIREKFLAQDTQFNFKDGSSFKV